MARYRSDPESAIQARVVKLFRLAGARVYLTSQYRISRQSLGVADMFVLHPDTGHAWWFETKRPGGKQSQEQEIFANACFLCGVEYVIGGYDQALAYLERHGIVAAQTTRSA